jgi:hypothetical protein
MYEARRVSKVPRFDMEVLKRAIKIDHNRRFNHNLDMDGIEWEPYTPMWEETDVEEKYEEQDYEDKNYLTIETSTEFKYWMYSTESAMGRWLETFIFVMDLWPMICMCNIVSTTSYSDYDEVSTELECINKAFENFNLLW